MQLAERIDTDRIAAEASRIDIGRGLLTLIAGLFYVLGWTAAMIVIGAGATVTWSIAAARIGWRDAHRPRAGRIGAA